MSDKFTNDLQARLSAFTENVSFETLSAAFAKGNFEGYRHLKGSFFGITGGSFDEISVSATSTLNIAFPDTALDLVMSSYRVSAPKADKAADHQDLALAA